MAARSESTVSRTSARSAISSWRGGCGFSRARACSRSSPTRSGVPGGEISAETIFLCTDRFTPELGVQRAAAGQVQTALAVTEPLPDGLFREIFPEKPLLVWDTDLVYQYFRPLGENRLLLGGGILSRTYSSREEGAERSVAHLRKYVRAKFPALGELAITHWWPGFIGVTKDFLPLAGRCPRVPSHALAICGTGLPWSMLAARVATRAVLEGGHGVRLLPAPGTQLHRSRSPSAGRRKARHLRPVALLLQGMDAGLSRPRAQAPPAALASIAAAAAAARCCSGKAAPVRLRSRRVRSRGSSKERTMKTLPSLVAGALLELACGPCSSLSPAGSWRWSAAC